MGLGEQVILSDKESKGGYYESVSYTHLIRLDRGAGTMISVMPRILKDDPTAPVSYTHLEICPEVA